MNPFDGFSSLADGLFSNSRNLVNVYRRCSTASADDVVGVIALTDRFDLCGHVHRDWFRDLGFPFILSSFQDHT